MMFRADCGIRLYRFLIIAFLSKMYSNGNIKTGFHDWFCFSSVEIARHGTGSYILDGYWNLIASFHDISVVNTIIVMHSKVYFQVQPEICRDNPNDWNLKHNRNSFKENSTYKNVQTESSLQKMKFSKVAVGSLLLWEL